MYVLLSRYTDHIPNIILALPEFQICKFTWIVTQIIKNEILMLELSMLLIWGSQS